MAKVSPEPNSGCWLWTACTNQNGYGTFGLNGSSRLAHRVIYEATYGPVPKGLQLDHLCRVRCCVNPDHLEPVTPKENSRRGNPGKYLSDRTHCNRGHPFSGSNLYITTVGSRACKACNRIAWRKYVSNKPVGWRKKSKSRADAIQAGLAVLENVR